MSTAGRRGSDIDWHRLRDAYGNAGESGEILAQISAGGDAWEELFSRVLHQGTLYQASAPVAKDTLTEKIPAYSLLVTRSAERRVALRFIAASEAFWRIQTNLLGLFGLPPVRERLKTLATWRRGFRDCRAR